MYTVQIFGVLLSAAAALVGMLVLLYLRTLKQCISKLDSRMDKQDKRMDKIEAGHNRLAERKVDCQRDFVSSEAWIRSETYTRRKLDDIATSVSRLAGTLKLVENMPQICGQIASDIVREMKNGGA